MIEKNRIAAEAADLLKELRKVQVLHIAGPMGLLFFIGTILFVYFSVVQTVQPNTISFLGFIQVASLINLVVFLCGLAISHRVIQSVLEPAPGTIVSVSRLRNRIILRLFILEFVAFFGSIVTLLAVVFATVRVNPVYWLNLCPAAVFIYIVINKFPTQQFFNEVIHGAQPASS